MKFKDFLQEQKEKHAVMAFGRMNPITSGHEKLVNTVQDIAKRVGGTAHIVVSHSQDAKKNPLTAAQKIKHAKRAFPGVHVTASDSSAPNFLAQAAKLHKQGVTHFHMVGGADRVDEFHTLLHKYNGVKGPHGSFNFKHIEVHSAGDRDPDAEGVEGMSASKMREHASKNNYKEFRKGVPSKMSDAHAKEMFNDVRKGMSIKEDINEDFQEFLIEGVHDKAIFKAVFLAGGPGSGKDYVLDNTLQGHGLTEINSDKALEFLMDKEGLDKRMPTSEQDKRDIVRGRAKNMTELRQRLALVGRNGLIINGTGDDHEKIKRIKDRLEEIGYDTSMIMVNTADEVSQKRNIDRGQRGGRTVPEEIRKQKWDSVQMARPELAKMFGQKYMEFDNSEDLREAPPEVVKAKKDEMLQLYKNIQDFVAQPPQSEVAQGWVARELQQKDTLPVPKDGAEMSPHPESQAAEEAKKLGLQYYGFGRYGRNGTVTHRSVHDKLVEVQKGEPKQPNIPVPGTSMKKKTVNEEFEEVFAEDLRNWFSKTHPEGNWVRMSSTGEIKGPCAKEPGEPKPKCLAKARALSLSKKERASAVRAKRRADPDAERQGKPINVRVPADVKKKNLKESYELSDCGALNILLLGNRINEVDLDEEKKEIKLLKDKTGKVRTFMLRRAAAREAHTINGTVMPFKNGYVIKLNEENDNVAIHQKSIQQIREGNSSARRFNQSSTRESRTILTEGYTELTSANEYAKDEGIQLQGAQQETSAKITLAKIRQRQKEKVKESIDKGIEPGLSMSASGENLERKGLKTKQNKKPFEEAIGAGGEDANSIGAKKEDELKKNGINLQSFKARRPIG